ncbi:hypothetical protein S7711_11631, partial [Stachybotrys chartarum IBT 7711]
HII